MAHHVLERSGMSKTHLFITSIAITMLGACAVDPGGDDNQENTVETAQAVAGATEIRLRAIAAGDLTDEEDDEIYLTAQAFNGSGINQIHRDGDPDYWKFVQPSTKFMNVRVGQLLPDGTIVRITLMEQDIGFDEAIADFEMYKSDLGFNVFVENQHAEHLGTNADGWHRMKLTGDDGAYMLYLQLVE